MMSEIENKDSVILGQKYAYATVSLILGIFCFVNLAGAEKAILAIIFGWLALRSQPAPILKDRRRWAQVGLTLGSLMIALLLLLIVLHFSEILQFLENSAGAGAAK